jgi:alpha-tubulin suppressor-like RCC1 family protein
MYKIYFIIFVIIIILILSSIKKTEKENFAFTADDERTLKEIIAKKPMFGMLGTIDTLQDTFVKVDDSSNYINKVNRNLNERINAISNRPVQELPANQVESLAKSSSFFDTAINENQKYSSFANQIYTLLPDNIANTSNYVRTHTADKLLSPNDKTSLTKSSSFFDTDVNDNYKYSNFTNQLYTLLPENIVNTSNYIKTLSENKVISDGDKNSIDKSSSFFDTAINDNYKYSNFTNQLYTLLPENIANTSNYIRTHTADKLLSDNDKSSLTKSLSFFDTAINDNQKYSSFTNQLYTLLPENIANTSNYIRTHTADKLLSDNDKGILTKSSSFFDTDVNDTSKFSNFSNQMYRLLPQSIKNTSNELILYTDNKTKLSFEEEEEYSTVGAGKYHSVYLMPDGKAMASGDNSKGQLGDGTYVDKSTPVYVKRNATTDLTNIKAVYAGGDHTIFLLNDGKVFVTGDNNNGQLGIGDEGYKDVNYVFEILTNVKSVSAGTYHSMFLLKDGTVKACGKNSSGQLGDGTKTQRFSLVDVKLSADVKLTNVKKISCGTFHTMFLLNDGTVMACGNNNNGQLGDSTTIERLNPVFVKEGSGKNITNIKRVACGTYHTVFLKNNGNAFGCGLYFFENIDNSNVPVLFAQNITDIYSGYFSIIYVKNSITFIANGYNIKGHLGTFKMNDFILNPIILDISDKALFISMGYANTLIYNNDNTVLASGNNSKGQLGINNKKDDTYKSVIFPTLALSTKNVARDKIRLAVSDITNINKIDIIFGCGLNNLSQLGNILIGNEIIKRIFNNLSNKIVDVIAGRDYTIILDISGNAYAIGDNHRGQLGIGNTINQNTLQTIGLKNIKNVYCSDNHNTYFIDIYGSAYVCGRNDNGMLGIGTFGGSELTPKKLNLNNIVKIAGRVHHTLFLDRNGNVYSCGHNGQGQLGYPNTGDISTPTLITYFNNINIVDISCGYRHSIFLDKNGVAYTCGWNHHGMIGDGSIGAGFTSLKVLNHFQNANRVKIVKVECGWYHSLFLDEYGKVYSCGHNGQGQLGYNSGDNGTPALIPIFNNIKIADIYCVGERSSFFIDIDGNVYSCGQNAHLQLGLPAGNKTIPEKINNLRNINKISGGYQHTIFLKYQNLNDTYLNDSIDLNYLFVNPTVEPYVDHNYINQNYNYIAFSTTKPDLVYDFTPHTTLARWKNYADSLGMTHDLNAEGGSSVWHHPGVGWIQFQLPAGYDAVKIEWGGGWNDARLLINNVVVDRTGGGNKIFTTENTNLYVVGHNVKIEETGQISKRLIITFSSKVKTTNLYTVNFPQSTECDILIVGGGGGGGDTDSAGAIFNNPNSYYGGGGAGAYQFIERIKLEGEYKIEVGEGGEIMKNGGNSKILKNNAILYSCEGGGKGSDNYNYGGNGGSGGGGKYENREANYELISNGNANDSSKGNNGAPGLYDRGTTIYGGGGGGAGGAGILKDGGLGKVNNITGNNILYAGGGGGGTGICANAACVNGIGGSGIGGNGAVLSTVTANSGIFKNASNGTINTGSGGGGGSRILTNKRTGGKGGSGIVIIRYKKPIENYNLIEPVSIDSTYHYYAFVNYGENQTKHTIIFNENTECEILIVAGGGGGGMDMGGGGGGGGVIILKQTVTAGNYTVTVGKGGNGAPAAGTYGQNTQHHFGISATNGYNSSFNNNIAIGGGYGGSSYWTSPPLFGQGNSGGSGGGSSGYNATNDINKAGTGVAGQGFRGGYGLVAHHSGGGGGAGEIGGGAPLSGNGVAKGGDGKPSDITGTQYFWGGGGGGAGYSSTGGNGGKGGGGGGAVGVTLGGIGITNGENGGGGVINAWANTPGGNGGAHTGGGGGGGSHYTANNKGGDGGSGIVIIKCKRIYKPLAYSNKYTM